MIIVVADMELAIVICKCANHLVTFADGYDFDSWYRFVGLTVYDCAGNVIKWVEVVDVLIVGRDAIACREEGRNRETE